MKRIALILSLAVMLSSFVGFGVWSAGQVSSVVRFEPNYILADCVRECSHTPTAFVNAPPCSHYYGQYLAIHKPKAYGFHQPFATCGYTPQQLESAYGFADAIKSGNDGSGVTVAIVDAYDNPQTLQDAETWSLRNGLPLIKYESLTPASYNAECGPDGWAVEQSLDIEAVHAMAPGATILYSAASDCTDTAMLAAEKAVLNNGTASIITNSWGSTGGSGNEKPNVLQEYEALWKRAAALGVSVLFSSGDNGPNGQSPYPPYSTVTPEYPASSPHVTAVGGTTLAVGSVGQYEFETGWSTDASQEMHGIRDRSRVWWQEGVPGQFVYGSGGGADPIFPQPAYQAGVVPLSMSEVVLGPSMRVSPDVAMDADPSTGLLMGLTMRFGKVDRYGEVSVGGTSLAAPLFAGVVALADQKCSYRLGFLNPQLYKLYDTPAYRTIGPKRVAMVQQGFRQGTHSAENSYLVTGGIPTELIPRAGYSNMYGLGSPNGESFLAAL